MKAIVDGAVIADSDNVIECKGYQYFPPETVRLDWLEKVAKTVDDLACPHGVNSMTWSSPASGTAVRPGATRRRDPR